MRPTLRQPRWAVRGMNARAASESGWKEAAPVSTADPTTLRFAKQSRQSRAGKVLVPRRPILPRDGTCYWVPLGSTAQTRAATFFVCPPAR